MPKQTLNELIAERQRLAAEAALINQRLEALSAEIDAHLDSPMKQQQQQQPQSPVNPPKES